MKTEKNEIRIAGLLKTSVADGPGVRSVLFLQGCSRNCPGCHNAGISTLDGGINLPIDDLVGIIRAECNNMKKVAKTYWSWCNNSMGQSI